ncbi:MAG TPA: 3-methyladenine DNA glycosylase [Pseudonocardiaceae bacterium]|nr:3-methyladenine DNA glycosylase [Pseudonocardiaceae bacterium]
MSTEPVVLAEQAWQAERAAHEARVRRWTDPHHARRARGEKHPVLDFLFTYYSQRPARLARWSPGLGVVLAGAGAKEFLDRPGFVEVAAGVTLDPGSVSPNRLDTAEFIGTLLAATARRAPQLGCFGLHEWAMVYRASQEQVRHRDWPLRLGAADTDAVLEGLTVRCGHFDAFRFFTPAAVGRNTLTPTRRSQPALEQPGCLHTNMDLFKWAYKLDPFVPAELTADCFELALRIRELDMRASPYDLRPLGYEAVPIETPQGRAEYARQQAEFAREAAPLRATLLAVCADLRARRAARLVPANPGPPVGDY